MRTTLILCMCTTASAITCLTTLNIREQEIARNYPGRIVIWNRRLSDFEIIEAFNQNYRSICSVDYVDDITGKTIVISGEVLLPYLGLNADKSLTGYFGDVWTTLEMALKFKTEFRSAQFSSGETFKRGDVDEWLAPITLSWRNSGHMRYSHEIGQNHYSLYAMSEGYGVSKWWYTSIFSKGFWATSIVFVIVITGLLVVMYRCKKAICRNYEECNNQLAIPSFNLLSVLGVMTGQGFQEIPTAWSLRLIILSAVIMGMLISCGFSSTLTSFLAIRRESLYFDDLVDVVRKKTHTLCVRNSSNAHLALRNMAEQDRDDWSHLINKNCQNMENIVEYRENLCRSGVVYVEAPDIFLSIYNAIHPKCRIIQIPGEYWSSKVAFLHARKAPHGRLIDKHLLRLRSAGILQYLERKWISKESSTFRRRQLTFKTVEYAHIDLVCLALIAMIFVSGFICILENIWFRIETKRARENMTSIDRLNGFLLRETRFPVAELDPSSRQLWTTNLTH